MIISLIIIAIISWIEFYALISKIIKKNVKIPVRVAGEIQSINVANKILKDKKADLIALGRSYLKNPNIILSSFNKKNINDYIPKPYLRGFTK